MAELWLRIVAPDEAVTDGTVVMSTEALEEVVLDALDEVPAEVFVERDQVIPALAAARRAQPDWRAGQLVMNAATTGRARTFYVEDDELAKRLRELVT